ncbi:MAG: arylsulfatase A [Halioglobus sp.]|jgi:arylsulfatase A
MNGAHVKRNPTKLTLTIFVTTFFWLLANHVFASGRPPNIILILSDDVGAETVGVYGGESYQTPRLDQLAQEGIRFQYAHAQPLCTPSRVKIMTGQYNFRNYTHFGFLDSGQTTFAHILQDAGYKTAVAGKWQLYNNRFEDIQGTLPEGAGFDEYLVWQLRVEQKGSRFWGPRLSHNGDLQQHEQNIFGPDVFNDYVLDYIEQHKAEPFFIYYPMVLAHDPWVTTPDMLDEAASDQEKFAAMMAYMDKLVGKVRDKVEQVGIAERTVIFFIGDNGTGRDIVSRQNGVEVAGAKGDTIDAGSRVPFLVWGPGLVKQGMVSQSLVNLNDVLPTLVELAGASLPTSDHGDGESLLAVLTGETELQRDSLFIHYEPRWPSGAPARYALDRRWKLYEGEDFFDTQADPLEQSPLDIGQLSPQAETAHGVLLSRIEKMPGELQSTRRWIPRSWEYAILGLLMVVVLVGWLLLRFLRR